MKTMSLMSAMLSLLVLCSPMARAGLTHTADVDVEFIQVDAKGKEHTVESRKGDFHLDWNTRKCEIETKKQFVYCDLDTSTDIVNSKGELVMKNLPQAHFDASIMNALIRTLGAEDRKTRKIINGVVENTAASRAGGFNLPFYSCGDCENNGKDLMLWNAFYGSVTREVKFQDFILRMKIKGMKPVKGAFNIIGNNNASDYGR